MSQLERMYPNLNVRINNLAGDIGRKKAVHI